MSYHTRYLSFIIQDQKNGFIREAIGESKKDQIIGLEKKIEVLENNCNIYFKSESEFMKKYEDNLGDYFMDLNIKEGYKDGIARRYPRGWLKNYSENMNFVEKGLDSDFSIWTPYSQRFFIKEFSGIPIVRFKSIGNYLIFMMALFKKKFDLASLALQEKNLGSKELANLIFEFGREENRLFNFYLYNAYLNRLILDQVLLEKLRKLINLSGFDNSTYIPWNQEFLVLETNLGCKQLERMLFVILKYEHLSKF